MDYGNNLLWRRCTHPLHSSLFHLLFEADEHALIERLAYSNEEDICWPVRSLPFLPIEVCYAITVLSCEIVCLLVSILLFRFLCLPFFYCRFLRLCFLLLYDSHYLLWLEFYQSNKSSSRNYLGSGLTCSWFMLPLLQGWLRCFLRRELS